MAEYVHKTGCPAGRHHGVNCECKVCATAGKDMCCLSHTPEVVSASGSAVSGVDVHTSYATFILGAVYQIAEGRPDRGTTTSVSYNLPRDNGTKSANSDGPKTDEDASESTEDHADGKSEALSVMGNYTGVMADHTQGCNCHTVLSTVSVNPLSQGAKTGTDRVNGLVLLAVKLAPDVSGVDACATNVVFDGPNTNADRGLMYTECSQCYAAEQGPDAGPVHDGDVDCRSVADECGCAADGDQTSHARGAHSNKYGCSLGGIAALMTVSNPGSTKLPESVGSSVAISGAGDCYAHVKTCEGGHSSGGEQMGYMTPGDTECMGDGTTILSCATEATCVECEMSLQSMVLRKSSLQVQAVACAVDKDVVSENTGAWNVTVEVEVVSVGEGCASACKSGIELATCASVEVFD